MSTGSPAASSVRHVSAVDDEPLGCDAVADELAVAAEHGPPLLVVTAQRGDLDAVTALRVEWCNAAAAALLGCAVGMSVPAGGSRSQPSPSQPLIGQPSPSQPSIGRRSLGRPPNWPVAVAHALDEPSGSPRDWLPATIDPPDGPPVTVRIRVGPVSPGRFAVWCNPVDVELAAAHDAAQEADFRFRSLGDNAPIGIVVSEAGLRLAFVNDCFAEIAGVHRSALLGSGWLDIVAAEDLPGLLDVAQDTLTGTAADVTLRIEAGGGLQRWVRLRLTPVTTRSRAAGFVGTVEDVTACRNRESQLRYQASHDSLTGLVNRRHLVDTLNDLFIRRRAGDRYFAVLFCDLDGFKQFNDTYGHDAGDRLLIEVARRMSATARADDLVARLAGDEFVVVLRHVGDRAEAEAAAERQLRALRHDIRVGSSQVTVSVSIGVAMGDEHDNTNDLLRAADIGMYHAKRDGGGRLHAPTVALGSAS